MRQLTTITQKGKTQTSKPQERRFVLRLLPILLSVILCCALVSCGSGGRVSALGGEALEIHSFADLEVTQITVEAGTQATDIALPSVLKGFVQVETPDTQVTAEADSADTQVTIETAEAQSDTQAVVQLEEVEVPVTWNCEAYDSEIAGTYIFFSQLMENYTYASEMPQIAVVVLPAEDAGTDGTTTPEPTATPEGTVTPEGEALPTPEPGAFVPEAYQITTFTNEPIAIEVPRGTAIENIPLPATLPATNALGEQVEVPVTWVNVTESADGFGFDPNDYIAGSRYGYGPWTFTATVDAAFTYSGESITASVTLPDCMTIDNIGGYGSSETIFYFVIFKGDSVGLFDEITANMTDGGVKNVPISWSGNYDTSTIGEYQLHMSVGGGYSGGGAKAKVSVIQDYAISEVGEQ